MDFFSFSACFGEQVDYFEAARHILAVDLHLLLGGIDAQPLILDKIIDHTEGGDILRGVIALVGFRPTMTYISEL